MKTQMQEEKAIFIAFNQAHQPLIAKAMKKFSIKGYTAWRDIQGQGSNGGVPHLGSHAWPTLNDAMLVVVPADKASLFLAELRLINEASPEQGLRAFVWAIEDGI